MSELKKPGRRSRPPGYQQQQSPNTAKRAGLLPDWVKDYSFLLVIGALVVIAALDQAAKAITWPGLLSVLGAVGAIVIWIWHAVARRRRAKEEARRQQELYAQSCLEQVDAMEGPRFEQYFATLLRLDGHQDVRVIGGKSDGGVDITSTDPSGRPMAYQCKRLKDRVRIDVIRQLNGSLAHEHPGRHGAVVTSAYLTKDADALARRTGIAVTDRTALAHWMVRARALLGEQGNTPAEGSPARHSPNKTGLVLGCAAVLLIVVVGFSDAAGAHSAAKASAPSIRQPSPATVIAANFAAINRRDWPTVWKLWYHPSPGYGPGYNKMITGYRRTARDVVTSLKASGDAVHARVLAYETTGAVQTYSFSFRVQDGKITRGRSVLLGTSQPSTEARVGRSS